MQMTIKQSCASWMHLYSAIVICLFVITDEEAAFLPVTSNDFFVNDCTAGSCGQPLLNPKEGDMLSQILKMHNSFRSTEMTTNMLRMSWDDEAAVQAQRWADQCELRHPLSAVERQQYLKITNFRCSQNIFLDTLCPITKIWPTWQNTIEGWQRLAQVNFTFGKIPALKEAPYRSSMWGVDNYTNLMWASSYKMGCGYRDCGNGSGGYHFFVCNYCPRGSIVPYANQPFEPGLPCGKCPEEACERGLCLQVVACEYENDVDNCESPSVNALFPNGCDKSSNNSADAAKCKATCNCRGKKLYWTSPKHPDVESPATNSSSCAARTVTVSYM